jgi:hypothetical protein
MSDVKSEGLPLVGEMNALVATICLSREILGFVSSVQTDHALC